MTVNDSHNITRILEHNIRGKFSESAINIHIEPCDGECADICVGGCLLPESERRKIFSRK